MEYLFEKKFYKIAGLVVGAIPLMYGGVVFLQGTAINRNAIAYVAVVAGIVIIALTALLSRKEKAQ